MSRSWFRENGSTSFHLPQGFWQFLGFVILLMARRKGLKWQKWETNHADAAMLAAPRPALRFNFCGGSLSQRLSSENEHKKQYIPPAAFLRITYIFNHKKPLIARMRTHSAEQLPCFPICPAMAEQPLGRTLFCFVLTFLTTPPLKKKKKKISKYQYWQLFLFSSGQILR